MTEAEWKEVDIAFEELCVFYLQEEYSLESSQFTRIVNRFIQYNKPFEIEVDRKYAARFDILITIGNSGSDWKISKNDRVSIYSYSRDSVIAEHDGVYFSMSIDQFKACFKPKENNNED